MWQVPETQFKDTFKELRRQFWGGRVKGNKGNGVNNEGIYLNLGRGKKIETKKHERVEREGIYQNR
jgi:hypothetical protein